MISVNNLITMSRIIYSFYYSKAKKVERRTKKIPRLLKIEPSRREGIEDRSTWRQARARYS